jgi:cytochrome c-type biogenesis protein CcmH/NrfG
MNKKYLVAIAVVAVIVVALAVIIPSLGSQDKTTVAQQTTTSGQVSAPPLAPGATMPPNHPAISGVTSDASAAATQAGASLDQIVKTAEDAYKKNPKDMAAVLTLGDAYFQAQRLDDSTRLYNEALALDSKSPDARAGLAMIDYSKGNKDAAVAALKQISQENPSNQTALYNLAVIYFSDNQRDLAKSTWQQVAGIDATTQFGQLAQQFVDLMNATDAKATTTTGK